MPNNPKNMRLARDIGRTPISKAQRATIADRPDLVTIGFDGLGVTCFRDEVISPGSPKFSSKLSPLGKPSKAAKKGMALTIPVRAETAIIRKEGHDLNLDIYTINNAGHWSNPTHSLNNLPSDVEISIYATSMPSVDGYTKYHGTQATAFSRSAALPHDPHDLRCLVHIEGPEFHDKKLTARKGTRKLSKLYIQNAEFYCGGLLTKGPNNPAPQPQYLERPGGSQEVVNYVGRELGAKIDADQVEIRIIGKDIDETIVLEKPDPILGVRYFVRISNTCDNTGGAGDFQAIYEFLRDTKGNITLDAQPPLPPPQKQNIPPSPLNKPEEMSHVRFCGAYIAEKQNGIGEILAAQQWVDPNPSK